MSSQRSPQRVDLGWRQNPGQGARSADQRNAALPVSGAGTASGQGRPSADDLIRTVKGARVFDLSFVWSEQSPILSLNPPYSFALNRTHKMT